MAVIDLKIHLSYPPGSLQEEIADVHRQTHFFSDNGLSSYPYLPTLCSKIPRQPQDQIVHLSRSIPLYGICPTNLSRKSQGYRSVSSRTTEQTLSHGHSEQCVSKHIGPRQQSTRLAHLRGLCSIPYQYSPQAGRKRRFWCRTRSDSLRTRCHNHRSLFISVPLGQISQHQSCHQTSYTSGFTGPYPLLHPYKRWQVPRRQCPRPINTRTRLLLHYGQRIPRRLSENTVFRLKNIELILNDIMAAKR